MDTAHTLFADGIHDDTQAIQALLDSGVSCVYLPPTPACYLISKTLKIGSNTELRLDRFTHIKLAPHSDCPMISNADVERGNRHVRLSGGIWDYDNVNQFPNPGFCRFMNPPVEVPVVGDPKKHDPRRYRGIAMYFQNVTDMVVEGLTLRNPVTYAFQACRLSYFVINDIEFDFTACHPMPGNMDGIHFDGGCHHGKISNLRGCCYDDFLALNANDGTCAAYQEPITDIDVDGIYCEYCHSAVRLLSTGQPVRRISIRNIHGNFYRYCVGLSHFFTNRETRGVMDGISIENCYAGKAKDVEGLPWELGPLPIVFCDTALDIGTLLIRNLYREETYSGKEASVLVQKGCVIDNLSIRDCTVVNRTTDSLAFLRNKGDVKTLTLENIRLVSEPGECILQTTEGDYEFP